MAKSDDVKELFLKAADELFFEKGYEKVSVADICEKCGKAKGLFFYYFEKKQNIVNVLTDRHIRQASETLKQTLVEMDVSGTAKLSYFMNSLLSKNSVGPRSLYYFGSRQTPDWFDYLAHSLKDKYIFPVLLEIVDQIARENNIFISAKSVEIVYLGVSAFIHRNYPHMNDQAYYKDTLSAVSETLENVLKAQSGSIIIE